MRTEHDLQADALYIQLGPDGTKAEETREIAPGVMLDLDASGELIGIEITSVSRRGVGLPLANAACFHGRPLL